MDIENGTKIALEFAGLDERVGSVLVGMAPDAYLILYVPLSHKAKKKATRKTVLTGRYVFQGTVFGFKSQILEHIAYPASLLFLTFPPKVEVLELRREPRVPCLFPGRVNVGNVSAGGLVMDMSPSGCRLEFKKSKATVDDGVFSPGLRVQLEFYAVEEKNAYSIYSEVVNSFCKNGTVSVGLRFDDVHKHFKKVIAGYVNTLAAELA